MWHKQTAQDDSLDAPPLILQRELPPAALSGTSPPAEATACPTYGTINLVTPPPLSFCQCSTHTHKQNTLSDGAAVNPPQAAEHRCSFVGTRTPFGVLRCLITCQRFRFSISLFEAAAPGSFNFTAHITSDIGDILSQDPFVVELDFILEQTPERIVRFGRTFIQFTQTLTVTVYTEVQQFSWFVWAGVKTIKQTK